MDNARVCWRDWCRVEPLHHNISCLPHTHAHVTQPCRPERQPRPRHYSQGVVTTQRNEHTHLK